LIGLPFAINLIAELKPSTVGRTFCPLLLLIFTSPS
jgi:hypothetical protein